MTDKLALTVQVAKVEVSKDVDGVELGVLKDGTPYVTGRGVARLCGVAFSAIINQKDEWNAGKRGGKFAKLLIKNGFDDEKLAFDIVATGRPTNAYTELVVMTFLEYYALDAAAISQVAIESFRKLAHAGLRAFVYTAVGYDPLKRLSPEWRQLHDRLLLDNVPAGYFNIFKESTDIVMAAIRSGLIVDPATVPDISIGQCWSRQWQETGHEDDFGARKKHDHNYPHYFPQAASNPQDVWIYPIEALGKFRKWMQDVYLPERFPKYLMTKVKSGALTSTRAQQLLAAVTPTKLLPS